MKNNIIQYSLAVIAPHQSAALRETASDSFPQGKPACAAGTREKAKSGTPRGVRLLCDALYPFSFTTTAPSTVITLPCRGYRGIARTSGFSAYKAAVSLSPVYTGSVKARKYRRKC